MEPWTIVLSLWLTTWLMLIWKTYSISMHLIEKDPRGDYITKYKGVHFVVYALGIFIITPFIWQVAIFENTRKRWVVAYVNGILGKKK